MNKTIFTYEESPYYPGKCLIKADFDKFYLTYTEGSYNIICARLMNMSYANYLRFCRDVLGATIIGKGTKYPVALFKKGENLFTFLKLLNARANLVIFERENPNHEEHKKELEKYTGKLKKGEGNVRNK